MLQRALLSLSLSLALHGCHRAPSDARTEGSSEPPVTHVAVVPHGPDDPAVTVNDPPPLSPEAPSPDGPLASADVLSSERGRHHHSPPDPALPGPLADNPFTPQPTAHTRPCGGLDRSTGLIIPCFDSARPAAPTAPQTRSGNCPRLDPETGLMVPCFQ